MPESCTATQLYSIPVCIATYNCFSGIVGTSCHNLTANNTNLQFATYRHLLLC